MEAVAEGHGLTTHPRISLVYLSQGMGGGGGQSHLPKPALKGSEVHAQREVVPGQVFTTQSSFLMNPEHNWFVKIWLEREEKRYCY